MEFKHLLFLLLCQDLNNVFFSETEAMTAEQQAQSTLLTPSVLYGTTDPQNATGSPVSQTTQSNNTASGQQGPSAQITPEQATPAVYVSSRPLTYNITKQAVLTVNNSFPQTSLSGFTLTNQLSPSAHNSTRQPPKPLVYTSTQQTPSPAPTPSGKPVLQTTHNRPTKSTPTIYLPRDTPPPLTSEPTSSKGTAHKTNHNAIAAILIGTIIISMLVAILMIILWKYLRKPVLNDQNWAGRSPFADGETPEMCMDNIRESEVSTKRASVASLMTWKPSKSTLLADDLEVKLFESSEHINDTNNLKTENVKDQINGLSEDSADGSTVGTAVSSSDDADLPLPPPLLDLDENLSDKPTMIVVPPLPNDSTNLQPSPDGLNQMCEDHHSRIKEPFPPPPDSFNVSLSEGDFINNQESTHEAQCQEFSTPDLHQDLMDSLPPPPTELL
ncbi:protein EVI2B [Grammomys surdaster]|uniref:protein EVI2B n=1 Tax=Grammomys surdaster TaxID=491861 RepID=UPI00109F0654|nr:protein EVI2B [Grammomys surdaster]XP_028615047.1 protein EVI2B [Grammomys surdaster]XP_028615048.1 protein EVI2B [Grammomys surdaster]